MNANVLVGCIRSSLDVFDLKNCNYHDNVSDLGDVPPECPDDDHGDDPGEEKDDDDAVDDGEPVDLCVRHLQVDVPPGRPLYVGLLPGHLDTGTSWQRGLSQFFLRCASGRIRIVQMLVCAPGRRGAINRWVKSPQGLGPYDGGA